MRTARAWLLHLAGIFNKRRRDGELSDELESHLQFHVDDNLRSGLTPEEARRQALIQLGGVEQTKEIYRERRSLPMIETLPQDLRFGARMLRKNPGFTVVAVLTLALSIGANTAIFSVIDVVLLRPLPYKNSDQLVSIATDNVQRGVTGLPVSFTKMTRVKEQSRTLQSVGAYFPVNASLTMRGAPEQIPAARATAGFFDVLGVVPAEGRGFLPEEDREGGADVAIISDGFWHSHFGASPDLIGQTIPLDGKSVTVVGAACVVAFRHQRARSVNVCRGDAALDRRGAAGRVHSRAARRHGRPNRRAAPRIARATQPRLARFFPRLDKRAAALSFDGQRSRG
ncbi:MAG TPA: ABC transporter permease [Candidatus Acidoferrales bacterium]|nr:ABC transporter permease [Candidatus Acidoferrales bacterium]